MKTSRVSPFMADGGPYIIFIRISLALCARPCRTSDRGNSPSTQAAGADPSLCNSTNRQNIPIEDNHCNFWTVMQFWYPLKNYALNHCIIVYFMTGSTFLTVWAWWRRKARGGRGRQEGDLLTYLINKLLNCKGVCRAAPGFAQVC